MPTRRQERVNGRIVQEVTDVIRRLKDPRIGFVTVTRADVSPDLRHAKVYISVLGEQPEQDRTLSILRNSASHIRREIGDPLGLRVTPRLEFDIDRNIAYADEMSRLIREARESDPNPGETGEDDGAEIAADENAEEA